MLCYTVLCYTMLYAILCCGVVCCTINDVVYHATLCYAEQCYNVPCHVTPHHSTLCYTLHYIMLHCEFFITKRLVGLVVKSPASRAADRSSIATFAGIFSGSSHTSDFKIGSPVATLPCAWRYRFNAGNGWPGVSIL